MKKIILYFTICFLSACSVSHGNFTILSNQQVNLQNFNQEKSIKMKNVIGVDNWYMIGPLAYGSQNININNALNKAFKSADGDLMMNAEIKYTWIVIPFLYIKLGWGVFGDVYKTNNN